MYLNVFWAKMVYYATPEKRRLIAKGLEKEVKKTSKIATDKMLKKLLQLQIQLATIYLYIDGGAVINSKRGKFYCIEIKKNRYASFDDKVWAEIQVCNQIRCEGKVRKAKKKLNELEEKIFVDRSGRKRVSYRTLFLFYWVKAVCNYDDLRCYKEYTKKARYYYRFIWMPDKILVDKFVCTEVWRGHQTYREGLVELWTGNNKVAQKLFRKSERLLKRALKLCYRKKINREADPLLHLAMLYAFLKKDCEKANKMLEEARKTGAVHVAKFTPIITFRCAVEQGDDPEELHEIKLNKNYAEDNSWGWSTFENILAVLTLYVEKQKNQSKSIIPKNYKEIGLSKELEPYRKDIIKKIENLLNNVA